MCSSEFCYKYANCNSMYRSLKPISFQFGDGFIFTLQPQEYLIDGFNWGNPGFCIFGIEGLSGDSFPYIIGDMFLKQFYSIYDFENR